MYAIRAKSSLKFGQNKAWTDSMVSLLWIWNASMWQSKSSCKNKSWTLPFTFKTWLEEPITLMIWKQVLERTRLREYYLVSKNCDQKCDHELGRKCDQKCFHELGRKCDQKWPILETLPWKWKKKSSWPDMKQVFFNFNENCYVIKKIKEISYFPWRAMLGKDF